MEARVGIVGSGGCGKSGLAEAIAKSLNIRYVASKNITRPILDDKGFNWSSGISVEEFLAKEECQDEIMMKSIIIEDAEESFATDRTSIDLAAYAIVMLNKNIAKVDEIVKVCRQRSERYTHLILCPFGTQTIERNEVRTLNPWFQYTIHSVMTSLLHTWNLKFLPLSSTGDDRVKDAVNYIVPKRRA